MRILLIDDEPNVTDRLTFFLERRHGHAVEALCWVEDEATLRSVLSRFRPEGVILDFEMEIQGDQIYRWVRQWDPQLRVVFYTKYGHSPDHHRLMVEAGADPFAIVQKQEAGGDAMALLERLGGRR